MHRIAHNSGRWTSNPHIIKFANVAASLLSASFIRSLVARLVERRRGARLHQQADAPSPLSEQENDILAELIAASSLLDFGGTLPEPRLKDTDLDRGLRPW